MKDKKYVQIHTAFISVTTALIIVFMQFVKYYNHKYHRSLLETTDTTNSPLNENRGVFKVQYHSDELV